MFFIERVGLYNMYRQWCSEGSLFEVTALKNLKGQVFVTYFFVYKRNTFYKLQHVSVLTKGGGDVYGIILHFSDKKNTTKYVKIQKCQV